MFVTDLGKAIASVCDIDDRLAEVLADALYDIESAHSELELTRSYGAAGGNINAINAVCFADEAGMEKVVNLRGDLRDAAGHSERRDLIREFEKECA